MTDGVDQHARELLRAAAGFQEAAADAGSSAGAAAALAHLEDTLRALSAGWYHLAAAAAQRGSEDSPEPEDELGRMAAMQDVGSALARAARECRRVRPDVAGDARLAAAGS